MDSRKKRSSSTTETSDAFGIWPPAGRRQLSLRARMRVPQPAPKTAAWAMLRACKFWPMPNGSLQASLKPISADVNLGLVSACRFSENGAIHVRGSGLVYVPNDRTHDETTVDLPYSSIVKSCDA